MTYLTFARVFQICLLIHICCMEIAAIVCYYILCSAVML
jgi:hypothetical protein